MVTFLLILLSLASSPVIADTVTTQTTQTALSTSTIYCPGQNPPIGEHIGFGNSTLYENFEVESWIVVCGQQEQYRQVHVAVTTAWINNGAYQKASSLAFSFENAYLWSPETVCDIIGASTQPAIALHLIQQAYHDQKGVYHPPAYGGQGDLCFENAGDYRPVFIVYLSNNPTVYLHQVPSQNPPYLLNIAPQQTSTTLSTVTSTVTTSIIVPQPQSIQVQAWYDNPIIQGLGAIVIVFGFFQILFSFWKHINIVGQLWSYLRKRIQRK